MLPALAFHRRELRSRRNGAAELKGFGNPVPRERLINTPSVGSRGRGSLMWWSARSNGSASASPTSKGAFGDPCGARDIGGLRDHRRREVDADVLADVRRERLRKEPRPAADVEHALVVARRDRADVARDGLGLVHVRGRDEAVDLRRELLDHVALRFLEARHAAIFAQSGTAVNRRGVGEVKPSPEKRIRLLSARNSSFSKQCPSLAAPVQNCAKASGPRQPTWESAAGPVIEIPERLSQSPAHRVAGPQGRANSSTRTAEAALRGFGSSQSIA